MYNTTKIHKTLRTTQAMAAGLTDKRWDMAGIVALPDEVARAVQVTAGGQEPPAVGRTGCYFLPAVQQPQQFPTSTDWPQQQQVFGFIGRLLSCSVLHVGVRSKVKAERKMRTMLIGEVARRSGVSAYTIRFYEQRKLIGRPARAASGYRVYDERVLDELRFIERSQRLGFALKETREILSMGRSGRMPCERVLDLCDAHLGEINKRMGELRAFRKSLRNAKRLAAQACGYTPEGFCRAIFTDLDSN